ncbi:DUF6221 family protein [Streptomyces sp. NPDC088785]|uniref:DUF6221 family protein n=1 Tax=Streptomyces sp. NPDC088785 TaxID=3365897 RepID=UPI00381ECD07
MDDLARWLTLQLDADTGRASGWHALDCDIHAHLEGDAESVKATMSMFHEAPGAVCDCGIPARMLREIEVKRQLLALHRPVEDADEPRERCAECGAGRGNEPGHPCATLRLQAAVYDQRPGYREGWRP